MPLETVTLMFTDLVGSTELAHRVGPGAAEALRQEHFGLLNAGAGEHGRLVKNLGDGMMFAFTGVNSALDAAVLIQQSVARRNRAAAQRFEVRIGIALGEVTTERDDYFGEPVVEAARLCALAEGGQVLVTDLVKLMSSSTTQHGFDSVGQLTLKGLPTPVTAHQVVWSSVAGVAMPLPMLLRGAPDATCVGRLPQRQALADAWQRAESGEGSLVLLAGEPGIGKTRLATQHAFDVHATGGTVLYGAVREGLNVPYQPWIESLAHYVDQADEALLRDYVAQSGADLVRLTPELARRVVDLPPVSRSDGETERYALLEATVRLLRAASEENPVLLVLEDLHWADRPTLQLLTHLHRFLAESRVLFVATFRSSDLSPDLPLTDTLVALLRSERVTRLDLDGLTVDEVEELLTQTSGQDTTQAGIDLARVLCRDTDGNPLFVSEMLRNLIDGGQLAQDENGLWGLTIDVNQLHPPNSVRDVVAQRVRRLGPEAHRLLATAAVIGRDFELEVLAEVVERPANELFDTLEAAMATSLLTEVAGRSGSFRFVHAVVGQALVDELSVARRVQLHQRIAAGIELLHGPDLGERVAAVARHLIEAGEDPVKTIGYARRAGQHMLAALAPDEALRWFHIALDLLDSVEADPGARCDLLADIGEAMREAGHPGYRESLLAASHSAEALADGERMARAVLAMNRSFAASLGTADDELITEIKVALGLTTEPDTRRARLLAQLAAEQMVVATLDERQELVDEALTIARTLDDATLSRVLLSSMNGIWTAHTLPRRRQLLDELRVVIAGVPDPDARAYTAIQGVWTGLEACDRTTVDQSLGELRAACDATAQPTVHWMLSTLECLVAVANGQLELAEQHAASAFERATEAGLQDGLIVYSAQLMGIRIVQGRVDELSDLIEAAIPDNPALADALTAVLALAHTDRGDLEAARVVLADVLARDPATWLHNNTWSTTVDLAATVANRCRDQAAAGSLYAACSSVPGVLQLSGASCTVHFSTSLGVLAATLGDRAAAETHFQTADRALVDFRAPVFLGINRHEHGRALLELGDPADAQRARDLLASAASAFRAHDCPGRLARCEELLASVSQPPGQPE